MSEESGDKNFHDGNEIMGELEKLQENRRPPALGPFFEGRHALAPDGTTLAHAARAGHLDVVKKLREQGNAGHTDQQTKRRLDSGDKEIG